MTLELSFALAFTVMSATTAFIRGDDAPLAELIEAGATDFGGFGEGTDNTSRYAARIRAGIGLALLIFGFAAAGRWSILPLGFALGGLLLLFSGGGEGAFGSNVYLDVLLGPFGAERTSDIAHFVVMLAGTLLFLAFGYWRLEPSKVAADQEVPSTA